MVFLKEFFEKVDFEEKKSRRQKSMQNYPYCIGKELPNSVDPGKMLCSGTSHLGLHYLLAK